MVSLPPHPTARKEKVLTSDEWKTLSRLAKAETADHENDADLERRREVSMALQRSWGQTGKTKSQLIAEYLEEQRLKKTTEAEDEAIEMEEAQFEARRKFVAEARKRLMEEDEGFGALKGAFLVSQVHAENERLIEAKERRKRLEVVRRIEDEKRDQETWREYEATLQER